LAVAALSGCSAPGNGLYAPLPQTPTAWNGADHPARDNTEGPAHKSARILHPKTEAIVGSIGYKSPDPALKPYSKEWFAQQEAIDREADVAAASHLLKSRIWWRSRAQTRPRYHRKKTRQPEALALIGLSPTGQTPPSPGPLYPAHQARFRW
jgi:hypothetical protein